MNIINSDQEKYHFLNMCDVCRYAQFLQAQSQIENNKIISIKRIKLSIMKRYKRNDRILQHNSHKPTEDTSCYNFIQQTRYAHRYSY